MVLFYNCFPQSTSYDILDLLTFFLLLPSDCITPLIAALHIASIIKRTGKWTKCTHSVYSLNYNFVALLGCLSRRIRCTFLHVWEHTHTLAGSCVQVYSALVLACFHEWIFFWCGRWTGLPAQWVRHSRSFHEIENFQRRKVVRQPLITTRWCVIGVRRFRHDLWGRWLMRYLAEVIFTLLVRNIGLLLLIKVRGIRAGFYWANLTPFPTSACCKLCLFSI